MTQQPQPGVGVGNPGAFGTDLPEDAADGAVTDPLGLLGAWLSAANTPVRPLGTLATIGADGYPNARHLLASLFDGERIHFHTDARSRKAAELGADPRATLAFVWADVGRQVIVTGDVVPVTEAERLAAFEGRSRYLQILAQVNDDGLAAQPAATRRAVWSAYDGTHPTIEAPPTWVGFALTPRRIVFWRGDADGPSNRVICVRGADGGWVSTRHAG
ncbi:pyridoxamine 5'-phosphate oxidase family protein [Nocardioides sp.]|uniref:pyridoxamine 5'-phosphate oxidase family protein n=1 Tax=Nocardioides sp. TaxID=35761 RepID=UPI0026175743|nr:pyridoxamine 5'-phosphate oxidase family protein [Nocardioides sp.]